MIGVILGFFAKDVNSILQWIVGALYGGYIAANMFKWYWWRFNANGFFWGMTAGIVAVIPQKKPLALNRHQYHFNILAAI